MPTIDTTQPVIGPAKPTEGTTTVKKNDALGKDEFLKLLVAQMKHQDPLNPMNGQEMAAQFAQFSSVEQLVNMNDTLAKIRELLTPAPDTTTDGSQTTDGTDAAQQTEGKDAPKAAA